MNKVMIGIITSVRHKHLLKRFMTNVYNNLDNITKDVVVVDTSKEEDYQHILREHGFPVIKQKWYDKVCWRIMHGRNKVREVFLNSDCTHLFSLDSDVMLPKGLINKYLSWDKDAVTGAYKISHEAGMAVTCVFAKYKRLFMLDAIGIIDQPQKVWASGLGCMLIKRKVLQKIKFRNMESTRGTLEDMLFCKDMRDNGFELYADLYKLLPHFNLGWGDLIISEQSGEK